MLKRVLRVATAAILGVVLTAYAAEIHLPDAVSPTVWERTGHSLSAWTAPIRRAESRLPALPGLSPLAWRFALLFHFAAGVLSDIAASRIGFRIANRGFFHDAEPGHG